MLRNYHKSPFVDVVTPGIRKISTFFVEAPNQWREFCAQQSVCLAASYDNNVCARAIFSNLFMVR